MIKIEFFKGEYRVIECKEQKNWAYPSRDLKSFLYGNATNPNATKAVAINFDSSIAGTLESIKGMLAKAHPYCKNLLASHIAQIENLITV